MRYKAHNIGFFEILYNLAHNPKVGGSNPPPATNQHFYFIDILPKNIAIVCATF